MKTFHSFTGKEIFYDLRKIFVYKLTDSLKKKSPSVVIMKATK